jgi:glycosyltransferase involved in cell wall biosynthesis
VRLLGVARLVPKKGVEVLLHALAALPPAVHWRYDHIGAGPLREALAGTAARLGLAERITWHGALPQEEVIAAYRAADLFVLASRIAADGDRDGLPNVLLEAGALELAVVASKIPGVSELIDDGLAGSCRRTTLRPSRRRWRR